MSRQLSFLAQQWRDQAETVACPVIYCNAQVGQTCRTKQGERLGSAPAHTPRMNLAGVDLPPVTEREVADMPRMRTPEMEAARMERNRAEAERYRQSVSAQRAREQQRAAQLADHRVATPTHPHADDPGPTEPDGDQGEYETEADVEWLRGPGARR